MKKQVVDAEWTENIRYCRESELTVSEWYSDNNINVKTYYYHLRKIRKKICEQTSISLMTFESTNPTVKLMLKQYAVHPAELMKTVTMSMKMIFQSMCSAEVMFLLYLSQEVYVCPNYLHIFCIQNMYRLCRCIVRKRIMQTVVQIKQTDILTCGMNVIT